MPLPADAASNSGCGQIAFAGGTLRPNRRSVVGLGLVAGFWALAPAQAATGDVSDWAATDHARVRLIDAGIAGANRLAGLQIELDPGFLTYWRAPGEAGVPPTVVFDGSRNLVSAQLAFPAPGRFDEGGSETFGYKDEVVFPIAVVPADPHAPVMLTVALSFAVCSALCLPASANVQLELGGRGDSPEAGLVRDALKHVPVPLPVGAAGPLAILAVAEDTAQHRAQVVARAPAGSNPSLFCEAAEPWYVQAGAGEALGDGQVRFDLRILAGAKVPSRIPVTLTLTTDTSAVETVVQLDAVAPAP